MRVFAFIDSQNLNLGIRSLGWKLDFKKFRVYLREKYRVERAYLFMGYIPAYESLYTHLRAWGYILIFKPVLFQKGIVKGNCDAELVLEAMKTIHIYDKACIVTGDGDFACLVSYLYDLKKLSCILSPALARSSFLLHTSGKELFFSMDRLRHLLSL